MSSRMKTVRRYTFRAFDYLIWAGFFGLLTYWYWYFSFGNVYIAYIMNILGISMSLLIDKIRVRRIYKKAEACVDEKSLAKYRKKNVTSLRTSLYLFYIFALIFSQMLAMGAPIEVSDNIRGYSQSVGYGVVFLFALDNFWRYVISDEERSKKYREKYKSSDHDKQ